MKEPIVIQSCLMRDEGDCAVCCLVMISGKTYGEVVAACGKRSRPTTEGLTNRQMILAGKKLGVQLVSGAGVPDDDVTAILMVAKTYDENLEHAVLWLQGVLLNPRDGEIWTDLDSFLKDRKWKVVNHLRREA